MRVYLAAPYGARDRLRDRARDLERLNMDCTSSWLLEEHEINAGTQGPASALPAHQVRAHALQDVADVRSSDALVLFTAAYVGVEGGGGRHVETGLAIALDKPVLVVGEPENVFHRIGEPDVLAVPDWQHALVELVEMRRRWERAASALLPRNERCGGCP